MKITKTEFKDLLIYDKETFKDQRGYFRELYLEKHFKTKFCFDVMSYSKKKFFKRFASATKKTSSKINYRFTRKNI